MATTTGGESGSFAENGDRTREVRLREATESAEICGATFTHLGMRDQGTEASLEQRERLTDFVRKLGVNLLLAHAPGDYHPDHRRAHELVTDVRMAAIVPNYGTEPPLAEAPDLAYIDTVMGVGFEPHVWIDVSGVMDVRRQMLAAHRSQVELMQRIYRQNLLEMGEALARIRGQQRGCEFAEAFRGCGTWPAADGGIRRLVRICEA
jgi:LmbE family N-acetylglucosaminyl deacetylase